MPMGSKLKQVKAVRSPRRIMDDLRLARGLKRDLNRQPVGAVPIAAA
jgi:hypothetical protein